MFGLYPRKGIIAPGADADILIWDPDGHTSIGVDKKHHMNMDYSAYEGFEVDGKVDTVLSRGTVVVENDTFVGRKGHGQFLKRGLSQYLSQSCERVCPAGFTLYTDGRRDEQDLALDRRQGVGRRLGPPGTGVQPRNRRAGVGGRLRQR